MSMPLALAAPIALIGQAASPVPPPPAPPPPCSTAEYRALDFCVGEWDAAIRE